MTQRIDDSEFDRELVVGFEPAVTGAPDRVEGSPRSRETRQLIMTAARESFVQDGIAGTRLAAVARSAWVAPSTVSLHFKGKEALFAACVDQEVDDMLLEGRAAMAGHPYPGLSGDLLRMIAEIVETKPLISVILLRSPGRWGHRFYESPVLHQEYQRFVEEMHRGQEQGFVRRDLDAELFGPMIGKLSISVLWSLMLQHPEETVQTEDTFAVLVAALFHPLSRALDLLEACEPWRQAHAHLPVRFNESPFFRFSDRFRE